MAITGKLVGDITKNEPTKQDKIHHHLPFQQACPLNLLDAFFAAKVWSMIE